MAGQRLLHLQLQRDVRTRRPVGRRQCLAGLLLCLALLCLWPAVALAQGAVEFRAAVDQTSVPVGGRLRLTLSCSGAGVSLPQPKLPALDAFRIVSSGSSQSISIVNGKMSATVEYTYVLVAVREGAQTIPPAEITIAGQVYRTQPIAVQVLPAGTAAPNAPATASPPQNQPDNPDLFIDTITDKQTAFIGEQVTLSLRFFQGVNLFDQPRYRLPAASGFWSEPMAPQTQSRQTVNGRQYLVTELKIALFGTSAGLQTVGAAELEINDFFVGHQILNSRPLTIEVKPLPAGQPADFAGAVGRYQVSAWLQPAEVRAHEPATLFFKVSGQGNIQNAPEPAWNLPAGIRAYDAKSSSKTQSPGYILQGEKIFEKLLVPEQAGDLAIGPLSLSYFDPQDGQYHRATSEALTLHVLPGAAEPPATGTPAAGAAAPVPRDIRHIKPAPASLASASPPAYRQAWFWLLWVVPALALAAGLLVQRRRSRLARDPHLARLLRSQRMAARRLKRARAHIEAGAAVAGCSAIAEALAKYIGDKANRPAAGLTLPAILDILAERGAGEDLCARFAGCWERCDQGRFAPLSMGPAELNRLLADAGALIVELEDLSWRRR
jgi:hypothetical protein